MVQSARSAEGVRQRLTKVRALLAGGLVLGVGATITLAVWNDSEFATGAFAAGNFGIEGAADGTTFTDHDTSGSAATLDFQLTADALTPGDTVYAGYAVQLAADSDYAASVTLSQNTAAALDGTTASHVYTTSATCDADAFAAGTDAGVNTFDLTALATPVYVCFQVTADDTLTQGAAGTITWEFQAESTDTL